MKDIGIKIKNKREEVELSIEEVAEDLKVDVEDIENLENGNKEYFIDIFSLKELISNYAKYLGLDGELLLDEFNEYMFSQTSRISLEDIEKAKEIRMDEDKEKIVSPYTIDKKENNKVVIYFVIAIIIVILICLVSFFVIKNMVNDNSSSEVSYVIGGR